MDRSSSKVHPEGVMVDHAWLVTANNDTVVHEKATLVLQLRLDIVLSTVPKYFQIRLAFSKC